MKNVVGNNISIREIDWADIPAVTDEDIEMEAMINEFEESVINE